MPDYPDFEPMSDPRKRHARPRDDDDDRDDEDDRPRSKRRGPNDGGVGMVIPYRNAPALIAYYWGVFGLIGCFVGLGFLGIVPIILGFLGIRRASQEAEAHGTAHAWVGIALGLVQVLLGCVAPAAWFGYMAATDGGRR
jgi:hypothetical protein